MNKKMLLGWIVIIVAALVVLLIVKGEVASSYLSKKLGVEVSMLGVKLRPSYLKISHFKISNPRGAKKPVAFSAETILTEYVWKNLMGNPSIIDRIEMDNVFLEVEIYNTKGKQNNWTIITKNLKEKEGKEETNEKSNEGKGRKKSKLKVKEGREVIIRKLEINNLDVEISGLGLAGKLGNVPKKKHLDHLEFYNISSKEGFPTKELIQKIFGSSGLDDLLKGIFKPEGLIENLKNFKLFGEGENAPSQKGDGA